MTSILFWPQCINWPDWGLRWCKYSPMVAYALKEKIRPSYEAITGPLWKMFSFKLSEWPLSRGRPLQMKAHRPGVSKYMYLRDWFGRNVKQFINQWLNGLKTHVFVDYVYIETEMSFWQNFYHWLQSIFFEMTNNDRIYQNDDIFRFSENGSDAADDKNETIWIMGSISIQDYPIVIIWWYVNIELVSNRRQAITHADGVDINISHCWYFDCRLIIRNTDRWDHDMHIPLVISWIFCDFVMNFNKIWIKIKHFHSESRFKTWMCTL